MSHSIDLQEMTMNGHGYGAIYGYDPVQGYNAVHGYGPPINDYDPVTGFDPVHQLISSFPLNGQGDRKVIYRQDGTMMYYDIHRDAWETHL